MEVKETIAAPLAARAAAAATEELVMVTMDSILNVRKRSI